MGTTPTLADGEEFVAGRSQAKAKELVELAEAAGLKGSVRTTYNGYIVPSAIYAKPAAEADGDAQKEADDEAQKQAATEAEADKNAAEARAAAEAEADNGDNVDLFDPSTATVDQVAEYLAGADDEERARVIAAEQESAKPRKGILDLAITEEEGK